MSQHQKGQAGEQLAALYLTEKGASILERNYKARGGEVDLIAKMGDVIVFAEVKARLYGFDGTGAAAVTPSKQRRICRAALHYLMRSGLSDAPVRFDVIEIVDGKIRHIESAFDYCE